MKRRSSKTKNLTVIAALFTLVSGSAAAVLASDVPAQEPESPEVTVEGGSGQGCACGRRTFEPGESTCSGPGKGTEADDAKCRRGRGSGLRRESGGGRGRSVGSGGGAHRPDVMQATHALVHDYRSEILREVENIDNGVVTVTRSPGNAEAAKVLKRHVREMTGLLEGGGRVRAWDPLFREIFDHYTEIEIAIEELEDGLRVVETSENPEVVKLIQAHAEKVSDFLARGPAAVHEPTTLPVGYEGASESSSSKPSAPKMRACPRIGDAP